MKSFGKDSTEENQTFNITLPKTLVQQKKQRTLHRNYENDFLLLQGNKNEKSNKKLKLRPSIETTVPPNLQRNAKERSKLSKIHKKELGEKNAQTETDETTVFTKPINQNIVCVC